MKSIELKFTHIHFVKKQNDDLWKNPIQPEVFLESEPFKVNTYDDLVMIVAQIAYYNRNFQLYFRGQDKDYKSVYQTIILPSIYRKGRNDKTLPLKENFNVLERKVEKLRHRLNMKFNKLTGTLLLNKYPEICWAILQHYEVCKTPLLDLTHSLHVACSFAFSKNELASGIVYVFGMPIITDSIDFYTYDELLNIKLLGICPPDAKRPYFQEGYLAGPFPNYRLDDSKRVKQFDFSRRLIAKFEIPIKDSFWGEGFQAIPDEKLFPKDDRLKEICDKL